MYPRFLRNYLVQRAFRDSLRLIRASVAPDASNIVPGNYLGEAAGFYVANFNESIIEQEDVGWVPGNSLRCSFPLDFTHTRTWVSLFVDIQPEFCR